MEFDTSAFAPIAKAKAEYEQLIKDTGSAAVKELLTGFLTKYPVVESITWSQYTPHFNDGDACVFSVHEPRMMLREDAPGNAEDKDDYGETNCIDWDTKAPKAWASVGMDADWGKVSSIIQQNEDLLQSAFGDHVEITATTDGVEVSEYNHD